MERALGDLAAQRPAPHVLGAMNRVIVDLLERVDRGDALDARWSRPLAPRDAGARAAPVASAPAAATSARRGGRGAVLREIDDPHAAAPEFFEDLYDPSCVPRQQRARVAGV